MIDYIWDWGIRAGFIFVASFFYAQALGTGIDCAIDEQHRMTPLSPWRFFVRGFKPKALYIAAGVAPWIVCTTTVVMVVVDERLWGWQFIVWKVWDRDRFPLYALNFGILGVAFSVITLFITRFRSLTSVAVFGTFIGLMPFVVFDVLCDWMDYFPHHTYGDYFRPHGPPHVRYYVYFGILIQWYYGSFGIVFLCLSWLHVRFRLDRAWFRFHN